MQIVYTIKDLRKFLVRHLDKTIGFVPTMGALHEGHISLIEASKKQCGLTICSIFVNPIQFNQQNDYSNYPKTLDRDIKLLENANCDLLFCPSVEEMYPNKVEKVFDFGSMATVMEGEHRPGHFNGVAIVIERFFEIINPHFAYFGEKDFQQLAVVKELTIRLKIRTQIIGGPIVREKSGLAMSSRNQRLNIAERDAASDISKGLNFVAKNKPNFSVKELKNQYMKIIADNPLLKLEYFEIANGDTLQPITNWEETTNPIAFTAVNVGEVRLIDNMTIIN